MPSLKQVSLTQRLTLMFVLSATAVLLALGQVVTRSVEAHFEELDAVVLTGKMELIEQALQGLVSEQDLTRLTHELARSLVGHHGLEVMVLDDEGSILFATRDAGFEPQRVMDQAARGASALVLWTLGAHTYRAVAAHFVTPARDDAAKAVGVYVAAAIDIGHHQAYMRSFVRTLWVFVASAAVLMGLLGWVAVRRGLAPLRTMRERAQVVTAQDLGHRLPAHSVPRELAELALSLNDMLARLEEAFARLSDFSSDIAHELRTPVSNLMTQTQVALSRARDAEEYRSVLESNAEEFERMARMISDMLLLAKAGNDLVVPHREVIHLHDEVQKLFDYYEAVAEDKAIALVVEGDGELGADRLMVRRALGNLLSNAIRHARRNSQVSVTINATPDQVCIQVSNTGDTIPPEYLERIFDRFFRVDPSRQRSGEGAGLGLAITKSIVLAHRGSIAVASLGGITTFTIRLPRLP